MSKPYSQEQLEFIKEARKTMTAKQISEAFYTQFKVKKCHRSINNTCLLREWKAPINGLFQKGCKPWNNATKGQGLTGANKGSFKKGSIPKNIRPIGSERICHREGYNYVKIAESNKWKAKHIMLWEEKNGPVPQHHVVIFSDGDTNNITIENLELASRHELLRFNISGIKNAAPELKPAIKMISKIQVKLFEKQREIHG